MPPDTAKTCSFELPLQAAPLGFVLPEVELQFRVAPLARAIVEEDVEWQAGGRYSGTVLVFDGNEFSGHLISSILEEFGLDVTYAASVDEVLASVELERYDLILITSAPALCAEAIKEIRKTEERMGFRREVIVAVALKGHLETLVGSDVVIAAPYTTAQLRDVLSTQLPLGIQKAFSSSSRDQLPAKVVSLSNFRSKRRS